MNIRSNKNNTEKLHLDKNDIFQIRRTRPSMELLCEKGILWITQSGDHQDYLLAAGQNLILKKQGSVLIEALREVEFKISPIDQARLN